METSNHRPKTRENVDYCERDCSHQFDNKESSRRSIDWRDSGIVIDDDHYLFQSFDTLSNFDTQSSIQSECNHQQASTSQSGTTSLETTTHGPVQRLMFDKDDDGDTILHLAVVGFTLEKVQDLIKLCDLNAINNMMQTPLHVAVLANRPEMVQLLVNSNAKLNIHDRRGNTPLHLACQRGLIDIVEIILAAISTSEQQNGQVTVQQMIETCNFDGLTCLHLAAINDKSNIIELLVVKYQANLNVKDSRSGETIVHKAIREFNVDLVAFILSLIDQHCNGVDYSGRGPLSTIKMLESAQPTDESQLAKLLKIKELVEEGIRRCEARQGCCLGRQEQLQANIDSSDCTDCSSASSDYSDSEYEMN